MWRALILVVLTLLAGCVEREPVTSPTTASAAKRVPFLNTDISGSPVGNSLAGFRDHHGNERSLADFRGKNVMIFFGYTACPDVCPTALSRAAQVMKELGPDAERLQVIFVTLDPERDTTEKLAAYVPWFDQRFIGLSADSAATAEAAKAFKIYYARHDAGGGMNYTIDHSSGSYVFDSAGRIRLYVKDDATPESIVEDLRALETERG